MNSRPEFRASVEKFHAIIAQLADARTPLEVSELERKGLYAMHDVQTSAAFIGVELRDAVAQARGRLQRQRLHPVENPVENSIDEKEFARLKKLLKKVSTLYPSGSTLRHKETNKEYRMGFQMTMTPYGDDKQYGIAVTILKDGAEKEELTFKNDEANALLTDYEPVKEPEPKTKKATKTTKKATKTTKKEK